jgi:ribonuclease T
MVGVANREVLISVDVEASGPSPATGSLIALGACAVADPALTFYRELRPIRGRPWSASAERVHGLTRAHLRVAGGPAKDVMTAFDDWIARVSDGHRAVMVGLNAAFDWMFVADYLERYLGRNPFGVAPLDLKALFMGRFGVARWADTGKAAMLQQLDVNLPHTHHALDDALMQAQMAAQLLARPVEQKRRP